MKKIWASESWAITSVILATLFFGTLSGYWYWSIIIALLGYIGWIYYRLLMLEKWISHGTRMSKVYDDYGFFGTIIRHLYQQKKINSERKKRTKEILGRLNRNISALPDATVLLNEYHEIEWCNEPARYLLTIDMRNDIGQRITNLIRHPDFLRYLEAPGDRQHLEIESPNDQNVTLQLKLVSFGNNQFLITARNISDQKQLQQGLKNFVANASHELKSPLTVISGHLEMLEAEPGLSESALNSLQTAQNQSQKMKDLIEDLLLLSQVESYHLQPDEGDRVDIDALMNVVIAALDVGDNRGRLKTKLADDLNLLGIKTEIEGICTNLIENALKYSEANSEVTIQWSVNKLGEVIFTVSDIGAGISDLDLPRITERYYRGRQHNLDQKSGSPKSGSGLGLSIVQQAANKHGAHLQIESQHDVGSRISVVFPSYRRLDKEKQASVYRLADY